MRIKFCHSFEDIISTENLLLGWEEFIKGKRDRKDVQMFLFGLMDNILALHYDLLNHTYKHGQYQAFNICDPKPRSIHKATVRDRLVHHAVYRILYPFFDKVFIADSFSCRLGKGTHKALNRFCFFTYRVSKNDTRTCWVLKGDIKKFFASIDQAVLINILEEYISDCDILWLLREVIESFHSTKEGVGLPLGNLTSQLLVNVYMSEFDYFVKHKLKAKHYIRYADDFVIFSEKHEHLVGLIKPLEDFLQYKLKLKLHPYKVSIKTLASGVDFLGWVHFLAHRVLRKSTKNRMLKRVRAHPTPETLNSYLGLLKHGNTHKLQTEVFKQYVLKLET